MLFFLLYLLLKAPKGSLLYNVPALSCFSGVSILQPYVINLVHRDLDNLSLLPAITLFTLFHYIDDGVLIGPSEQELATTLTGKILCVSR